MNTNYDQFKSIEYFAEITGIPWTQNDRGDLLANRAHEKALEILGILDNYGVTVKLSCKGAVSHLQIPQAAISQLQHLIQFRKAFGVEATLDVTTLAKAVKKGSLSPYEREQLLAALKQMQDKLCGDVAALAKRSDLNDLEQIFQKVYDNCCEQSNVVIRFIKGLFYPVSTMTLLCEEVLQNIATAKIERQQNGKKIIKELYRGSPDLTKLRAFIAAGADKVREDGFTPLMLAAHRGHAEAIFVFFVAGADANEADSEGRTALYLAASEGRTEAIQALLAVGADVNKGSDKGWTPLHWAALEGYEETTQVLLAAGADVNKVNAYGHTPLHLAFKKDQHEIVHLLLEHEMRRGTLLTLDPKLIARNLITIINLFQEDSKPFIFKAAKEAPEEYVSRLVNEPNLLRYILGAYPLTIPENSVLHPLIITPCASGGLDITTVMMKPLMRADDVLIRLSQSRIARLSNLHINYLDTPGVDRGGLLRQFLSQLFSGLMKQKLDTLKFNPLKKGGYLPEISPIRTGNEFKYLNTIGKLLAFALDSKMHYPIGEIFGSGLYALFLKLSQREVATETEEFIKNLSDSRMLELYQPLVDSDENDGFSKLKHLLQGTDIEQVRRDIAYFVEIGILDAEFENDLMSSQKKVFEALRDNFTAKLSACHAIARGLNNSLPLETVREWDYLKFKTIQELSTEIQGVVNKETLKKYVSVIFDDKRMRDRLKNWIDEWIDRQTDMQAIKNFLQVITGAPTVSFKIKFRMSRAPLVQGLNVHTCFNDIDVPATVTKETLYAQFDSWGRGEGIGEFTQA